MRYFIHTLICLSVCCGLVHSFGAPIEAPSVPEEPVNLQLPNNPVGDVLSYYEKLTGKVLVRDANLTGPNLTIMATGLTKSKAIGLIEANLLLNGYSLVPDGDNRVKVINAVGGKNPRSEGVPLVANSSAIPKENTVISYFMQFRFLSSADAVNIIRQHVMLHGYGSITEVPNAQALVITENSTLIRQLVNLQELIDVPPARVISEFVTLQRADAERVAEIITKLIESQKADKQKRASAQPPPPPNPGNPAAPGVIPGTDIGDLFENDLVSGSVQLIPDPRTNRILVITRPANFAYVKNLIAEFDQAVGLGAPLERPLKYVSAAEVLPVLADFLTENDQKGGGGASTGAAGAKNTQQPRQDQSSSYRNNGSSGGSSTGANAHPDELSEPETGDMGPTSVIVGKTRLIADNKANAILVIGAPESQEKVRTILDKLDKRPPQVYLSTVIGQMRLTKDNEFGIDYLKLFQNSGSGVAPKATGLAGSALDSIGHALVDPRTLTTAAAFPPASGLVLYGTIGKSLSIYVRALESTNRFKVLARPVIYTANNKKAVISSGQRVAVPTSTLSNVNSVTNNNTAAVASNIEYEDVVLKLEVVPLINANNEVNLKISQVDDSISGSQTISGNTVPTISTQKINTTVTVPSGGTVVLGGLITESTTTNLNGIPVLMHLPWVGSLFRDTVKNKERNELVILIQPQVVQTNEDVIEATRSETTRARVGNDAMLFAEPPLPEAKLEPFIPKKSTGLKK